MAGTIPEEVILARLKREAAARDAAFLDLQGQIGDLEKSFDEKLSKLAAKTKKQINGKTVDSSALISVTERVVTGAGFAMAERIDILDARVTDGTNVSEARLEDIRRVVATTEYSLAEWTRRVTAQFNDLEAVSLDTLTAYATKTFAEAKRDEAITASAGTTTAAVNVEAIARASADGVTAARWSVEVNANGKIAGLRIGSESDLAGTVARSYVDFKADVFRISTDDSVDGTAVAPFSLSGSTLELNALLVVNGTGTDLGTIAANASVPALNSIGDFASAPSPGSYPVNSVYHNTTDGNTYVRTTISTWALFVAKGSTGATGAAGATGATGSAGSTGTRGSKAFFATGGSWVDSTADAAITAAGLTKVLLDQVTISNGTSFAETRFWDGSVWATIAAVINGNLLVNGTVGASKISTTSLSALSANLGTVTLGSIAGSCIVSGELDVGSGDTRFHKAVTGSTTFGDTSQGHVALQNFSSGTSGLALRFSSANYVTATAQTVGASKVGQIEVFSVDTTSKLVVAGSLTSGQAPILTWNGDTNLYRDASNSLKTDDAFSAASISSSGSITCSSTLTTFSNLIATGSVSSSSFVRAADGSTSSPGFNFNGATNSGVYHRGSGALGFIVGGAEKLVVRSGATVILEELKLSKSVFSAGGMSVTGYIDIQDTSGNTVHLAVLT